MTIGIQIYISANSHRVRYGAVKVSNVQISNVQISNFLDSAAV